MDQNKLKFNKIKLPIVVPIVPLNLIKLNYTQSIKLNFNTNISTKSKIIGNIPSRR